MTVINIHLGDSLEAMKSMEQNQYDLAIIDPPYAININMNMGRKKGKRKKHKDKKWDVDPPSSLFFDQLFKATKNQIIWGGNYFELPSNKHFIFWDKLVPEDLSFSDGEYAWTSFDRAIRKFTLRNITNDKIHPTQKPVALYKWLLKNYAKEGDKILDTHGGSMSIVIACIEMGFDLDCWEIDEEYFDAAVKRIQNHVKQLNAFIPQPEINIFK